MFRIFISLVIVCGHVRAQTGPNFCTYDAGVYTCDYASMVTASDRPIDFTQFSQAPQRLKIKLNGCFPFIGDTQVFSSGFGSISVAAFDPEYPATLTIDCSVGGSLYFPQAGGFANMSYIQRLEIKNCDTVFIPSTNFKELENLDYFGFENGYIDGVDPNAMYQSNVEKLASATHNFPRKLGRFEVRYSTFPNKVIPPGFLFSWKNLTAASFIGSDVETITSDLFRYNTKLRYIDLSDNLYTSIPTDLFKNLDGLSDVTMYNIEWTCSCSDLWFVPHTVTNNITLFGDFMCSNQAGTTVFKYYYDSCITVDICEGATGIVLMEHCYNVFAMTCIICGFIAMVISIVCLVLVCLARKQQAAGGNNRRVKARGRWNKIMDSSMKMKALKKTTKK